MILVFDRSMVCVCVAGVWMLGPNQEVRLTGWCPQVRPRVPLDRRGAAGGESAACDASARVPADEGALEPGVVV